MDAHGWFVARFHETVTPADLRQPRAAQIAALLQSNSYGGARLLECRRDPDNGFEILLLQVEVPLGQRALVNPIEAEEPIAVLVGRPDLSPYAYPLRADFPVHVPHFNVAQRDQPRSLCLYELPAEEVRRTYTAVAFVERIRWWFVETAYGRLHGEGQPLDPLFHQAGLTLILDAEIEPGALYLAGRLSERDDSPVKLIAITPSNLTKLKDRQGVFATAAIVTDPVDQGPVRTIPVDMAELIGVYDDIGVDVLGLIKAALLSIFQAEHARFVLDRPFLLIITTPLRRDGGEVEAKTIKAFIMHGVSAGQLAVTLGVLIQERGIWAQPVGYAPELGDLSSIELIPADTHEPFNRRQAEMASGRQHTNPESVALLGAGALGSQIALIASRGGFGRWTIVDHDVLLPHNLARHGLGPEYVGYSKAETLAYALNRLLGAEAAEGIHENILDPSQGSRWPALLSDVRRIIDASASVPVARWLACDCMREVRAASCFMSPSGQDAVVLIEGEGQTPRLDHLEMIYYRHLIGDPALADHLASGDVALYVGGCRNPSVKIPQTQVSALASCIVEALCVQTWPALGRISLWRSSDGLAGIAYHSFDGEPFEQVQVGTWTVWVRRGLLHDVQDARERAGGQETGGILVGTWDRDRKIAYIVSHYDPPPDSVHEPTGFVRGTVGVFETVADVHLKTRENLTYIGEWHTHPPGCGTQPSRHDEKLLWWIHDALQWSDAPALILIAGDDGFRIALQDCPTTYNDGIILPLTQ